MEKVEVLEKIKHDIHQILENAIRMAITIGELKIDKIPKIVFSPTKTLEHGDIATPIALSLSKSGAFSIVLECITPDLAKIITKSLKIPTTTLP